MDVDNSGKLDLDEFTNGIRLLNDLVKEPLTETQIKELYNALDTNKDGLVDYDEFLLSFQVVDTGSDARPDTAHIDLAHLHPLPLKSSADELNLNLKPSVDSRAQLTSKLGLDSGDMSISRHRVDVAEGRGLDKSPNMGPKKKLANVTHHERIQRRTSSSAVSREPKRTLSGDLQIISPRLSATISPRTLNLTPLSSSLSSNSPSTSPISLTRSLPTKISTGSNHRTQV